MPYIRTTTTKFIISKSYRFTKKDYLVLINYFLEKPDDLIIKTLCDDEETLLKIYSYDPETWRKAVTLLGTSNLDHIRFLLWGDRMQYSFFCWGKFNVIKLTKEDQTFLLDALIKTAESDQNAKVRARAGWTLGLCLSGKDSQKIAAYNVIKKRLETCSQNDTDKRVCALLKQCLTFPSRSEDDVIDDFLHTNKNRFVWPKEAKPVEEPRPQPANDF